MGGLVRALQPHHRRDSPEKKKDMKAQKKA